VLDSISLSVGRAAPSFAVLRTGVTLAEDDTTGKAGFSVSGRLSSSAPDHASWLWQGVRLSSRRTGVRGGFGGDHGPDLNIRVGGVEPAAEEVSTHRCRRRSDMRKGSG
jgi:hypothetical protein